MVRKKCGLVSNVCKEIIYIGFLHKIFSAIFEKFSCNGSPPNPILSVKNLCFTKKWLHYWCSTEIFLHYSGQSFSRTCLNVWLYIFIIHSKHFKRSQINGQVDSAETADMFLSLPNQIFNSHQNLCSCC